MGKKSLSGWTTRIIFPRAQKPFFWIKMLKFFVADPGSRMEKNQIRDKRPGSATLLWNKSGSALNACEPATEESTLLFFSRSIGFYYIVPPLPFHPNSRDQLFWRPDVWHKIFEGRWVVACIEMTTFFLWIGRRGYQKCMKSVWKDGFLIPYSPFEEKKFSSLSGDLEYCLRTKRWKIQETSQYFEKRFFYKTCLKFPQPF